MSGAGKSAFKFLGYSNVLQKRHILVFLAKRSDLQFSSLAQIEHTKVYLVHRVLNHWLTQFLANDRYSINTDGLTHANCLLLRLEMNPKYTGLKTIN